MLESFTAADQRLLFPHLRPVTFAAGQPLPVDHARANVHFPTEGLLSIRRGEGPGSLESALVGREGMIGPGVAHARQGDRVNTQAYVAGRALSIPAVTLRQALNKSPSLQDAIRDYGLLCLEQANQAVFAASRCSVEQRIASWIIMALDRLQQDDLSITHDVLATALGVRRPGVTVALHMLEGEHAITASRGHIKLRSLERLKARAGNAHQDVFYQRAVAVEAVGHGSAKVVRHASAAEARP